MLKFTIGLMSGKTVKFSPDEYDMAKKGFNSFNRSDNQECELYSYLTKIGCFVAKDDHGDDVLCVTNAVESIRKTCVGE